MRSRRRKPQPAHRLCAVVVVGWGGVEWGGAGGGSSLDLTRLSHPFSTNLEPGEPQQAGHFPGRGAQQQEVYTGPHKPGKLFRTLLLILRCEAHAVFGHRGKGDGASLQLVFSAESRSRFRLRSQNWTWRKQKCLHGENLQRSSGDVPLMNPHAACRGVRIFCLHRW